MMAASVTSRLRVLHVGKFYPPARGGMETVLQVLAEGEHADVDNHVLVANTSAMTTHEVMNGVPVTRVAALGKVGAVALCPTFPFWLRRLRADIVVIHEPNPVALVAHFLARPRGRVVFWVHAEVVRPAWRYRMFYRPFLLRLLQLATRIVVASPPLADSADELQPFRHKCVVIPYALEARPPALTAATSARAEAIRKESRSPVVLFVGRLVPYKGVDVLIKAIARTDARAVIVGTGPLRGELEALTTKLTVADRVRFAGDADDTELAALYEASELLVLPSVTRAEAFGMVQVEAMAFGKPVISTNLRSGVPWVNQHGVTGLVVSPGDVDALADAVQQLLADEPRRREMGRQGKLRVEREFTVARVVQQLNELYRAVMQSAGSNGSPTSTVPL